MSNSILYSMLVVFVIAGIWVAIRIVIDFKRMDKENQIPPEYFEALNKNQELRWKADVWEKCQYCAPGDFGKHVLKRCKYMGNCHNCLLDYAYLHSDIEIDIKKEKNDK